MEKFIKFIPNVNIIVFFSVIEFLIKNNDLDSELSISLLKSLVDKVTKVKFKFLNKKLTDITKAECDEDLKGDLDESTKSSLTVKIFNSIRALFDNEKRIQSYKVMTICLINFIKLKIK